MRPAAARASLAQDNTISVAGDTMRTTETLR